jgi:hypothetical protein
MDFSIGMDLQKLQTTLKNEFDSGNIERKKYVSIMNFIEKDIDGTITNENELAMLEGFYNGSKIKMPKYDSETSRTSTCKYDYKGITVEEYLEDKDLDGMADYFRRDVYGKEKDERWSITKKLGLNEPRIDLYVNIDANLDGKMDNWLYWRNDFCGRMSGGTRYKDMILTNTSTYKYIDKLTP